MISLKKKVKMFQNFQVFLYRNILESDLAVRGASFVHKSVWYNYLYKTFIKYIYPGFKFNL